MSAKTKTFLPLVGGCRPMNDPRIVAQILDSQLPHQICGDKHRRNASCRSSSEVKSAKSEDAKKAMEAINKVSMNRSSNTQAQHFLQLRILYAAAAWHFGRQMSQTGGGPTLARNPLQRGTPIPPTTGRTAPLDASRRVMPTHCWCRLGIDLTSDGSRVSHATSKHVFRADLGDPLNPMGFSHVPHGSWWPNRDDPHDPWCPVTTNRPYREAHNFCTWRLTNEPSCCMRIRPGKFIG